LGFLDPARLAKLDHNAQQMSGDKASKTIALHARIYATARAFDANTACVIHTHSTHCVALTLQSSAVQSTFASERELLPAITPYFVMKVGHVPVIDYHRPGATEAAGQQGTPIRAVMLSRLGPNVWHDTPAAAMATLEELEETAKLMHTSHTAPTLLSTAHIEDLKKTFGARW
jgi:ribulose-5-phosphate 4-epimerase/fuculose-1-phosphate aldolase